MLQHITNGYGQEREGVMTVKAIDIIKRLIERNPGASEERREDIIEAFAEHVMDMDDPALRRSVLHEMGGLLYSIMEKIDEGKPLTKEERAIWEKSRSIKA
jgi:hypothetical protein